MIFDLPTEERLHTLFILRFLPHQRRTHPDALVEIAADGVTVYNYLPTDDGESDDVPFCVTASVPIHPETINIGMSGAVTAFTELVGATKTHIDEVTWENAIGHLPDDLITATDSAYDKLSWRRWLLSVIVKSHYEASTLGEGQTERTLGCPIEVLHLLAFERHDRGKCWEDIRAWPFLPKMERLMAIKEWRNSGMLVYHGGEKERGELPLLLARDLCVRATELIALTPMIDK